MSTAASNRTSEFSLAEARRIVGDLFSPSPVVYWLDFLATYSLGVFCFQKVRGGNMLTPHQGFAGTWTQAFFFVASCLLFYRAGMFIHELVHQRNGALPAFRLAWNLMCGIPFLMPSFVYYTHIDHHRRAHYGTDLDGEYLPLGNRSHWHLLFYLSSALLIPIVVIARFLVFSPLAWVSPQFRRWTHRHFSSLVIDPSYIRPLPTEKTLRIIRMQEAGCFLWCLAVIFVPRLLLGIWPIPFVVHAYLMGVSIVVLNSIRTLGSHRWANAGGEMTFVQQLLDSVNYPRSSWISEIWGPVGTRYHALHHLFPSLPYHRLAEAHARLSRELPADSPYHLTEASSLRSVLLDLWKTTRSNSAADFPFQRQVSGVHN